VPPSPFSTCTTPQARASLPFLATALFEELSEGDGGLAHDEFESCVNILVQLASGVSTIPFEVRRCTGQPDGSHMQSAEFIKEIHCIAAVIGYREAITALRQMLDRSGTEEFRIHRASSMRAPAEKPLRDRAAIALQDSSYQLGDPAIAHIKTSLNWTTPDASNQLSSRPETSAASTKSAHVSRKGGGHLQHTIHKMLPPSLDPKCHADPSDEQITNFAGLLDDAGLILTDLLSHYQSLRSAFQHHGLTKLFHDTNALEEFLQNHCQVQQEFRNAGFQHLLESAPAARQFMAERRDDECELHELRDRLQKIQELEHELVDQMLKFAALQDGLAAAAHESATLTRQVSDCTQEGSKLQCDLEMVTQELSKALEADFANMFKQLATMQDGLTSAAHEAEVLKEEAKMNSATSERLQGELQSITAELTTAGRFCGDKPEENGTHLMVA